MFSEGSDGTLGQLVEPEDDPSEEEEEVELEEDGETEDELVVSVDLYGGANVSEGCPAVELVDDEDREEEVSARLVRMESWRRKREREGSDSLEEESRRCSSTGREQGC